MNDGPACDAAAGSKSRSKTPVFPPLDAGAPGGSLYQPVRDARKAWLRTQPQLFLEVDEITAGPGRCSPHGIGTAEARQERL